MIIKKHQTLADFATQHGGSIESLYDIAMVNGISMTAEVEAGTELTVVVKVQGVVNSLARSGSEVTTVIGSEELKGGIGYMQIDNDFIVT